jgi:tyrosine-protein phosphatase YwqE
MGFVDIHSHILHGLDDGAKTFEESVEMLRIATRSVPVLNRGNYLE